MSIAIEMPDMGEGSAEEKLLKLQGYLHRTAQQLQWAFDTLEPGSQVQVLPGVKQNEKQPELPSPEEVFAGIRQLIIKSADIVDAYTEKIRKNLEGSYVAKSDFGAYEEKTAQELTATSQALMQLFSYSAEIRTQVKDLRNMTATARAYIRTGLLSDDPVPVYGLEIGQRNTVDGQETFRKFARFTADRLSFFDRWDREVAYISDYRLYIQNAEIKGSLDLGTGYRMTFDPGLTIRWKGGRPC